MTIGCTFNSASISLQLIVLLCPQFVDPVLLEIRILCWVSRQSRFLTDLRNKNTKKLDL